MKLYSPKSVVAWCSKKLVEESGHERRVHVYLMKPVVKNFCFLVVEDLETWFHSSEIRKHGQFCLVGH